MPRGGWRGAVRARSADPATRAGTRATPKVRVAIAARASPQARAIGQSRCRRLASAAAASDISDRPRNGASLSGCVCHRHELPGEERGQNDAEHRVVPPPEISPQHPGQRSEPEGDEGHIHQHDGPRAGRADQIEPGYQHGQARGKGGAVLVAAPVREPGGEYEVLGRVDIEPQRRCDLRQIHERCAHHCDRERGGHPPRLGRWLA